MDIEAELPEDFDSLSAEEKVSELQELKKRFEEEDENLIKIRMIEELISNYRD